MYLCVCLYVSRMHDIMRVVLFRREDWCEQVPWRIPTRALDIDRESLLEAHGMVDDECGIVTLKRHRTCVTTLRRYAISFPHAGIVMCFERANSGSCSKGLELVLFWKSFTRRAVGALLSTRNDDAAKIYWWNCHAVALK